MSEPNSYVHACTEKNNGKTVKDMLEKLQESSFAVSNLVLKIPSV